MTVCFLRPILQVHVPHDPVLFAWQGASRFAQDCVVPQMQQSRSPSVVPQCFVTRTEYLERGHHHCNERLAEW